MESRHSFPVPHSQRIEGLIAYAQAHGEWEQLEELKARLDQVIKRIP